MFIRCLTLLALVFTMAAPAQAQNRAKVERDFQNWVAKTLWPKARRHGIKRPTFDRAFQGVTFAWDIPGIKAPGVAKTSGSQNQAEFRAPSRYFAGKNLNASVRIGASMLKRHAKSLQQIERKTGVPGRIAVAIWGRESGFGRVKIPHNVFRVLATRAFVSKGDYMTSELLGALEIAQKGLAPAGAMKSSWAGALGQPQMMPRSYLAYAADGTGDGKADIWGSEVDTLASIANFLSVHDWVKGRDWGFEVTLPKSVSCTLEGPDQGMKISKWEKMGVTRANGKPFPKHERRGQGFLMLPAGRNGPAFLVTPNFYVLKRYNRSDLYALYVGHAGDRTQYGGNGFRGGWGKVDKLLRSDVAMIQKGLERQGHDVGGADGLPGFKTRRSIGRWQEKTGQAATCFPSRTVLKKLR